MSVKPLKDRVTLVSSEVLADDWVPLVKHTIDYERRDGRRERLTREVAAVSGNDELAAAKQVDEVLTSRAA